MKRYDLSSLEWKLTGTTPYAWMFSDVTRISANRTMEAPAIPAKVPGSVQVALRETGLLPDWNVGLNAQTCEWVENRHWIFETVLPAEWLQEAGETRLECAGLDDRGWVLWNGKQVGRFEGAHTPHVFRLPTSGDDSGNLLQIIFDLPPRWLGQFGYTSQMTEWKPRFYYTWDWVSRLVQIGVWDEIALIVGDGREFLDLQCLAEADAGSGAGCLRLRGEIMNPGGLRVRARLVNDRQLVREETLAAPAFLENGFAWDDLAIQLWWPNGMGEQNLYRLTCELLDGEGAILDRREMAVGFKQIDWRPCEGAPAQADPWLCLINDRPVFLQGFNWTPVRPNFADVTPGEVRQRLEVYRDMGCNILRVWGGAVLEREDFYQACDELGLLVWQEFPLSSSGIENWPPEDETSMEELSGIARSFIRRRRHHVSLLMWGGGNELQGSLDGGKTGIGKPVDLSHPLIARFAEIAAQEDPLHRFMPSSPSGPRFSAVLEDVGKGLHWDVHGPWKAPLDLQEWRAYWQQMDGLIHSEVGAPGASPADVIVYTSGGQPVLPANEENPLWRRNPWWIEWADFIQDQGHAPSSLEEYVGWSQERQARALSIVARTLKQRFPRCGGVIFWMGHDCFPCTTNTSVIDYWGRPKPAALALAKIFRADVGEG